jgi:hypothetical protein
VRLTNKLNLPQPIFDAVKNDPYTKGDADISVSELINPPRIRQLKKRHDSALEEDASDRLWSLLGQLMHLALERANTVGIAERRLSIESEGWKISGGMDRFESAVLDEDEHVLQDYKLCSAWKIKLGDLSDWENQLNVYAEMLRQNGDKVTKLEVFAILRDWSKGKAEQDAVYPQKHFVRIQLPLWSQERAQKYIRERVILHKQAELTADEALPQCTPDERWVRDSCFAVMKKGRKKAENGGLHETKESADAHAAKDPSFYVVYRPGKPTRCKDYCIVNSVCNQFQELTQVKEKEESVA